ncbi:tetratricopeptide repeat protein [Saccharophagus degradans]|uniref:YfgM family protein n=1 Tax=Saccharophagus degradans TaxID=86304 RepID=UPI002478293A|nr:tetratricopeptide repeat protein [Saccharophagus degradans]WGO97120.1 tetratricopeptide repeat protein [Saccharophagus degradans]
MSDHITEEEQIEAIKRWWSENWASIVLPVVILIVGYAGWSYWGDYKEARAQEGSAAFQVLLEKVEAQPGQKLSADAIADAQLEAQSIASEFSGSLYADMSNLLLARLAVESGKLDEAEAALNAVIASPANESVVGLAKARLAKVYAAQGKYAEASTLVGSTEQEAYKALYAEIRGDIALAQGDLPTAHTAYNEALNGLTSAQYSRRGLLDLKIQASKTEDVAAAEAEAAEAVVSPEGV